MKHDDIQTLLRKQLTRREFLGLGALLVASAAGITGLLRELQSHADTASASLEPENGTRSSQAVLITDTAASNAQAVKFTAPQQTGAETPSYGPNGTHKPLKVVDFDTAPNVTVDCSWAAISSAIATAQSQPSSTNYVIGVSPGTLTGKGIGNGATAILSNLLGPAGNLGANRNRRILVKPASGYGSITVNGGMKVTDVNGIVFAGLIVNGGIHMEASNSAYWRIKTNSIKMLRGQSVELVEVYATKSAMDNDDTADLWAFNGDINDIILNGVWIGPSWGDGTGKHIDTIQFEPFTGFGVKGLQIKNSHFVGRVQTNAWTGPVTMTHNLLLSQGSMASRYPIPTGGFVYDINAIMNGGGANCQATLNDWTGVGNLTGEIGTKATGSGIVSVTNAKINGSPGSIPGFTKITTAATALAPAVPSLPTIWG